MTSPEHTLPGPWRAIAADDETQRAFSEPGLDDSSWARIPVPGHWQDTDALADADGPVLYRTRFEHPTPPEATRAWLRFDGLFYQGDVFLDGAYLGDTEGYFVPHEFEITDALRDRSEHALAVEVGCAPQRDRTAKRNITGVFQHWSDGADPARNPGGIWRPVSIVETGPVRIRTLRVRCLHADEQRAEVGFRAVLDAAEPGPVTVRSTIGAVDHGEDHSLASGENVVEWRVVVDRPRLWWPHALGDGDLADVEVTVLAGAPEPTEVSDRRRLRTGLRRVSLDDWVLSVNGERLFVKGANQGPTDLALADVTGAECERDVRLAVDAGLDLLRLHGHVARPETYAAADEAGLLLWQDFPLQWGHSRQIRKQAIRQARSMVDLLAHHPSIAVWCGHNEPVGLEVEPGLFGDDDAVRRAGRRYLLQQQLPTWNKTILDRSVKRAIDRTDGTRPVIAHSGVLPHLPTLDGTDSHLWFGWLWGEAADLGSAARAMPRLFRFVSEFGTQAVPQSDDFVDADRWPDLDWDHLVEHHGLQHAVLAERVPPAEHDTYESWKAATQRYQADLVRHHVETLRRLKYRPTGGFAVYCLADGADVISRSLVDHDRVPKAGYRALRDACAPVIVVADPLPATVRGADALALDVHVVSDRRRDLTGRIRVTLEWDGGGHEWLFEGDVAADSVARVGTVQFEVPEVPGSLRLSLSGTVGADAVERVYETRIVP